MNRLILQILAIAPGLTLALAYGRFTGDMQTAFYAASVLIGMWVGVKLGGLSTRAPT